MKGSWQDFWYQRQGWSFDTFGPPEIRGPEGPLKHLVKEVEKELLTNKPNDREKLLEEYADCIFLIYDASDRAGFTLKDLLRKCWEKLEINKKREWPIPTTSEPVEHIREGDGR